jgi:tetratricopeptide (TPR) repeat protein
LADAAVRRGLADALPDNQRASCEAVLAAFRHYEVGHDEAAREALQAIGLNSPFLDWKLLLRGLMAYANGDDARALENWRRLDPARLPAQVAAPFRMQLDPAYRATLAARSAAAHQQRYEKFIGGELFTHLRKLQGELGRDKPLTMAWKYAAAALPLLRRSCPELAARLARCLYHAIGQQGEPADLGKYRHLFGPPPDDPHFHRLEALISEETGHLDMANSHWAKYENWLASNPPGWPPEVAKRARAIILFHMGQNAAELHARAQEPEDDFADLFDSLFRIQAPRRRRPATGPKPETYYLQSIDLAPDWPAPARALFYRHLAANRPSDAEQVARTLLARKPDDLPALEGLAALVQRQGRAEEALTLWKRALATNPLDRRLRVHASSAYHAAARQALIAGRAAEAEAILVEGQPICSVEFPVGFYPLRAVTACKLGRAAEADVARNAAFAVRGGRLAAALFFAVDSALAQLKPAAKRAADQAFNAALAAAPTPLEVNLLYAAWDSYHTAGISYRGQKAQEKKIIALVQRCLSTDAPEQDYEILCVALVQRRVWKLAEKVATHCERRFSRNPVFKVSLAEILHAQNPRFNQESRILRLLEEAKRLAETSGDPRHAALMDTIDKLRRHYATPAEMFEFVFGHGR